MKTLLIAIYLLVASTGFSAVINSGVTSPAAESGVFSFQQFFTEHRDAGWLSGRTGTSGDQDDGAVPAAILALLLQPVAITKPGSPVSQHFPRPLFSGKAIRAPPLS